MWLKSTYVTSLAAWPMLLSVLASFFHHYCVDVAHGRLHYIPPDGPKDVTQGRLRYIPPNAHYCPKEVALGHLHYILVFPFSFLYGCG